MALRSFAPARAGLLAGVLALAACQDGDVQARPAGGNSAGADERAASREAGLPAQVPWSGAEGVARVLEALEEGRPVEARKALAALGEGSALDRHLLTARLRAAEGDGVGMVAEIEAARGRFGDQGRVYATAAELHAAAGRIESAEDEVRAGLTVAGPTPALLRARGVLALARPGGARAALEHLLAARAEDPALPFCDVPLSQAHVLLGRRSLAEENVLEALGHARAALAARPGDPDAMELLAETQTQTADYDGAIATYEALLAAGLDVADTLAVTCQRGSTAALLAGARRTALERALRARELGLSSEELGFGARLIEEEAERALDRGVEHFAAGRLDGARSAFELAVRCLSDSLEAHNHLAVALHASDRPAEAAEHWERVVTLAREQQLELPEPVHVRLAAALRAEGRADEARAVLERYLGERPDGRWAEEVRAALE